ncbi:MAG TPA: D-alanyl-D-alanine carboxypeptidase/D-alanyl-D-alanine-endopeptidase [Pyrinomonadaceae bacterium]|jgi:D-alanyl-D-alanine carboxypeptidase/D-alanyl-D-alanine-endopeptidase (penicillin-binding protein 4)|nr:D-alanyl-D-alanine carboxypeptidase/D-alanyl-D-alanine-endopeptidase [Pyrinomonadaceae bacterium]
MKRIQNQTLLGAFISFCLVTGALTGVCPSSVVRAQSTVPASSRSIIPAAKPPATLAELRSRIEEICRQPALDPGFFAVKIVSLDSGQTIFEQQANKFVRPASNMKLYTVATAFDRLTADYHFITSVYAKEKPEDGRIKGDLVVYGRGDPSISTRFTGDYFKAINDLADRIVAAGVKRVKGDLVGDASFFNGSPIGSGWEWEDLTWSYGAPVSALSINDNAIDLNVRPGATVGAPVTVTTGPANASFITIVNRATTSPKELRSNLQIYRGLGANTLEITGTLPIGDAGFRGGIAIPDPPLAFVSMLRDALLKRGVKIDGQLRTVNDRTGGSVLPRIPAGFNSPTGTINQFPVEITSLSSPPFATVAAQTLKPSQNQYTELILRTLGRTQPQPNVDSGRDRSDEELGLSIVRSFLHQAGIADSDVALDDGSGLSRNDLISANTTVQLLTYMAKHKYFAQFRDALPIAGVDGTLSTRMRGTPAEKNLRAKTGSLSSVASLSGYVTTAGGDHLVFSMMLNNYPDAAAVRRDSIDAIAVLLASYTGKS